MFYFDILPVELKILVLPVESELRGWWLIRKDWRRSDWTQDSGKRLSDRTRMLIDEGASPPSRIWVRRHLEQRRKLLVVLLVPVINLHRTGQLLKTEFGIFVSVRNFHGGLHVGRSKTSKSFVGRIVSGSILLLLQLHQSCTIVDAEPSILVHWAVSLGVGLVSCGLAKWTNVSPEHWTANNTSWSLESVTAILDLRLSIGIAKGTNLHVLCLDKDKLPPRTLNSWR